MVSLLIDLRRTVTRHQLQRTGKGWLIGAGLLGLASAAGTLTLGIVHSGNPDVATDVLALLFALWLAGRCAQTVLAGGDATLRPELFALLGVPRRRLALALLAVGLLDPGLALLAIALGALIASGAQAGPAAALVGVAGVLLSLLLAGVLSTLAGGLLAPGSRRGRDAGTIVTATGISLLAVAGTLAPTLITALRDRSAPWLSDALRALPSGWAPNAVAAAARADWTMTALPLLGLAAVLVLAVLAWPAVLTRRMTAAGHPAHPGARAHTGRRLLPRTSAGAVAAKELRLWARDPIRLTCLLIALVVGAGACAIPRVTAGTTALLPFAGALTTIIAGACACNLYGSDGTSLWLTISTPRSAAADVRGRQVAWLMIVAPYALACTLALTAISGQPWAWTWALALLPALLGGAAGLAPLASLISVQPPDETGGLTPAWSLKVHIALIAVPLTALPPALTLLAAAHWQLPWLTWTAIPAGIATGLTLTRTLGNRATARLTHRQVPMLRTLADATG